MTGRIIRRCRTSAVWICAVTAAAALRGITPVDAAPSNNSPQTRDAVKALPDWSGTWEPANRGIARDRYSQQYPLTPQWQQKLDEVRKIAAAGGDVPSRAYHCVPLGPPAEMAGPEVLLEFLFTPGRVTIDSVQGWLRRIYIGAILPEDPDLSFQGSSVGHWDADTLVIETIGLDPQNELMYGLPIGKDAHVTERLHLKDANLLELDVTVDRAESLSAPYHYTTTYRRTKFPMTEFDCAQNNRDVDPSTGKQGFDVSPQH